MTSRATLRRTFSRYTLALSLLSALPAVAALPDSVSRALKSNAIPAESVALWVAPAAGGQVKWQHNAERSVNPASVMKLVTSFAALDILGPAYTWKTQANLQGELRNETLNGNLIIRGSGDPALSWDRLSAWMRDWRARGLKDIQGDIVIDRSLFATNGQAPQGFDASPQRAYNATPDAFLVNFNALTVRLAPDAGTQSVSAASLIPTAPLRIVNQLKASDGACNNWRDGLRYNLVTEGDGLFLQLDGRLPVQCGERLLNLAVPDGLRWSGSVLRALWKEQGGNWTGEIREARAGDVPATQPVFSTWESAPITNALRDLNKFSNNVMARQVFLTLGMREGNGATSTEAAASRLRAWMPTQGLDPARWVFENGSGLSRNERTTAEQLGALLRAGWASPRMPDFLTALPILGIDGTMRSRMTDTSQTGRGYIKTGTLDGVKAAAGYVMDAKGRWQAFSFVINHANAQAGEPALEALIRQIYGES